MLFRCYKYGSLEFLTSSLDEKLDRFLPKQHSTLEVSSFKIAMNYLFTMLPTWHRAKNQSSLGPKAFKIIKKILYTLFYLSSHCLCMVKATLTQTIYAIKAGEMVFPAEDSIQMPTEIKKSLRNHLIMDTHLFD